MTVAQDTQEVVYIPLPYLVLAPENLRQAQDEETVETLKASIRESGLLQNLVGYQAGGVVAVVAGGHRLKALQELAAEGHPVGEVPVLVLPREKALLLSLAENLARKDLSPLEEAEAVAKLLEAGLGVEAVARELGRSEAYVRGRAKVASRLSPSWREALHKREVPFATASLLAELPEEEQEKLFRQYGVSISPDLLRFLMRRGTVSTRHLLPGVKEAYLAKGGPVLVDLEGEEYLQNRALALQIQEEAARALAERLGGELLLDVSPYRFTPDPEGRTYVVLYTGSLEVKVFSGVRLRGGEAGVRAEEVEGEAAQAAPEPKAPEAKWGVSRVGRDEREALHRRAHRERAARDEASAKAALVLSVARAAYVRGRAALETDPEIRLSVDGSRLGELKGAKAARERLEELLQGVETLEDLAESPHLDEAFRLAVQLVVGRLPLREPALPTLGMADAEHLGHYTGEVLEAACREVGVAPGKTKKETIARLLERKSQPFPKALLEAKAR